LQALCAQAAPGFRQRMLLREHPRPGRPPQRLRVGELFRPRAAAEPRERGSPGPLAAEPQPAEEREAVAAEGEGRRVPDVRG